MACQVNNALRNVAGTADQYVAGRRTDYAEDRSCFVLVAGLRCVNMYTSAKLSASGRSTSYREKGGDAGSDVRAG